MTWFNSRIGGMWTVGLNVHNLFDKEPPQFGTTNNNYDGYGRRYNLSANFSW